MALTFHFSRPSDLLAKLSRDQARLQLALASRDTQQIADSVFDFANTAYCIKDWLKENTNGTFQGNDVEAHVNALPVLSACRDICNANKHYIVTKYVPITQDVYVSASGVSSMAVPDQSAGFHLESSTAPEFKVKILLKDGSKFEVSDFAHQAVAGWETFFKRHGL